MNRNRLPRWLNGAIDAVADAPTSLAGRAAALRMGRPAPHGSVRATTFDHRPTRVLIAPVNYSGQATGWARALERADPNVSARSMAVHVPGGFDFDADLIVPVSTYHNDADWQRRQLAAATSATHVLIEAEEPPFGRLFGRSTGAQASALIDAGVDVAFLGHGTDIRLPSRHIADNIWSYYADESVYVPRAEVLAQRNIDLVRGSGRPLFVSTPDLLLDLPEAAWCPVVLDLERWSTFRTPRSAGDLLRVAHAPSVAAAKGTNLVMPVLEKLAGEGLIDLDLISGIPSAEIPARFARADVVLDQFRAGSYGVAACEALATGCAVVGNVSQQVRDAVREHTGRRLPIIDATPSTIEAVLRDLASSDDAAEAIQERVDFVRDVHDGRRSASVLLDDWIAPPKGGAEGVSE